jgi:GntR family transcriptional regulator
MRDIKIAHANPTLILGVADMETAELLRIGLGEPTANCRLVQVDSEGIAIYVADIRTIKDCFAMHSDPLAHRRTRLASLRRGKARS